MIYCYYMKQKLLILSLFFIAGTSQAQTLNNLKLWYDKPAANWNEALPIGNGHVAAMIFGTTESERLQLNEETIWAGEPGNNIIEGTYDSIQTIRRRGAPLSLEYGRRRSANPRRRDYENW